MLCFTQVAGNLTGAAEAAQARPLDRYVEWFRPFARHMVRAASETGRMVVNIRNRVANRGPLRSQRHPHVYQLVLALQRTGWR